MHFPRWVLLFVAVSASAALVACGGCYSPPSNTNTMAISIAFSSPAPASLQVSGMASLAVSVANDSTNAGVKWSVTCASASGACGSFSTAGPASSTTYTAPSALPSVANRAVIVMATSVADSTKSVSANIILIPPGIGLAFTSAGLPPNALQAGASAPIAVTVTGDTSNNGVSWTATCGPAAVPCGRFSLSQTASGAATTFTAPSFAVPPGGSATVTATSVTNPGNSISIPIFISVEPTTLADGSYVFTLSGTNANHFYSVSGVFTVSNGLITGGEQDFIDPAIGAKSDTITGGSILAIDDGDLLITLKTADTSVGVNGVETLDASLFSSAHATLSEFDSSASASGTLELQTATSAPSGAYAFFSSGRNSGRNPTAIAGVLNVDGPGTISGTGSVFDINDDALALPLAAQTFAASTVTSPDAQGRVLFNLVPSAASGIAQISLIGYIVDAKHILLVETTDTYGAAIGGMAIGQTPPVTSSSVSGVNFVFGARGNNLNGVLDAAGLLTPGPNMGTGGAVIGNVTGTFSWNDHTGVANQTPLSLAAGSYTLDTTGPGAGTGRVSLNGLTDSTTNPTFSYDIALYLVGNGEGLLIFMDKNTVATGESFQQTGGPFTSASFNGSYALNIRHVLLSGSTETRQFGVGTLDADGINTITGFFDLSPASAGSDLALSGNFTANANGVFTGMLTGLDTSPNPTAHNFAFYLVSPSQVLFIETDNAQLTLGSLDLQK